MKTLGRKIGQIKGLQSEVQDNLYLAKWGGHDCTVWIDDKLVTFETNSGIKTIDKFCIVKAKEGILTIHEL